MTHILVTRSDRIALAEAETEYLYRVWYAYLEINPPRIHHMSSYSAEECALDWRYLRGEAPSRCIIVAGRITQGSRVWEFVNVNERR